MKKFVLFIVMIGLFCTSIFAGVKHCKKGDAFVRMNSTKFIEEKNRAAKNSPSLPVEKGEICNSYICFYNPQKLTTLSPPTSLIIKYFSLYISFYPQHFTAPPYAPPKASFVHI